MAKVDVIVLNYNGRHFLRPCLTALRSQTFQDFQVTLVDNGSADGSVALVRTEFPEVRIIPLPENLGFCGGNNRGIEATSGSTRRSISCRLVKRCYMLTRIIKRPSGCSATITA